MRNIIFFHNKKRADKFVLFLYNIKVYINTKYVQEYSSSKTMLVYFFHSTVVVFILRYAVFVGFIWSTAVSNTVSGDELVSSVV